MKKNMKHLNKTLDLKYLRRSIKTMYINKVENVKLDS